MPPPAVSSPKSPASGSAAAAAGRKPHHGPLLCAGRPGRRHRQHCRAVTFRIAPLAAPRKRHLICLASSGATAIPCIPGAVEARRQRPGAPYMPRLRYREPAPAPALSRYQPPPKPPSSAGVPGVVTASSHVEAKHRRPRAPTASLLQPPYSPGDLSMTPAVKLSR